MRYLTHTLTVATRDRGDVTAKVQIEIDEEAIIAKLGTKAIRNSSGQAIEFGGLVKARVIK